MKLTFLGKYGGYPDKDSPTSSFLLEEQGFSLLVDCGSGVLSEVQKYINIEELDACILSHYHHDHIADIGCLQYAMLVQTQLGNRSATLPIYGHQKDTKFANLTSKTYTTGVGISEEKPVEIGTFTIHFCPTTHSTFCLAMKFIIGEKSIVYTADTEWNEQLVEFATNADILISEASIYKEQYGEIKGHLTGEEAGKLAQLSDAKQLYLTHLPHYGDHAQLIKEAKASFNGDIQFVYSGLVQTI